MDIVKFILPIIITSTGYAFWLWSRGGKIAKWPRELDEEYQALYAPIAALILRLVGAVLIVFGLYRSYNVSWILIIVSFFAGAFLGKIVYTLLLRRLVE